MKKFLLTIILSINALCAFANPEVLSLIEKAQNAQLDNAKDAKSTWLSLAKELDSLSENGVENANIYTMTGNAYLFANKIGLAIYSYKNALRFEPYNEEILNNLAYAQSLCANEIEANSKDSILDTYFFNSDFIKHNALWIFLVVWNLIFIIALTKTKITEIRFIQVLCIIFSIIFGTALAHEKYIELTQQEGVISKNDTIARKGASDIFMPAYKEALKDGTQFIILGEKNDWLHIKLQDGSTSWISKASCVAI